MIEMKTLTMPNGKTYEIVDDKARKDIASVDVASKRDCVAPIVQTAEGRSVAVTDSSNRPIRNLRMFGKTEQTTTTGKQLINVNSSIKTTSGITFTPNEDGSITLSGTATAEAYYIFDNGNNVVNTGTELVATITGSSNAYMVVGYYKSDNTVVNDIVTVTNNVPTTFTYPAEAAATRTFIGVQNGKTVNVTVYPMIRLATETDSTFEPYTGGIASPNPDHPQDLVSAVNPSIGITGANLFDASRLPSTSRGGVEITNNGDGSLGISGLGTTTETCSSEYSISHSEMCLLFHPGKLRLITNVKTYPMVFVNLYKNGGFHSTIMSSSWSRDYAFELPDEYFENDIYSLRIGLHANANATIINGIVRPILTQFEGDIDEEYKEQQTITINRTLNGIGDVRDEIDFKRGVYIQRIGVANLYDYVDNCIHTTNETYSSTILRYDFADVFGTVVNSTMFSNRFPYKYAHGDDIAIVRGTECISTHSQNDVVSLFIDGTRLAESNKNGLKAYLAENEVIIQYVRKTPIETPLTEGEIVALNTLYTHKTNTSVINNAGAEMEVEYSVDLETFIRKLVAGLGGSSGDSGGSTELPAAEGVSF